MRRIVLNARTGERRIEQLTAAEAQAKRAEVAAAEANRKVPEHVLRARLKKAGLWRAYLQAMMNEPELYYAYVTARPDEIAPDNPDIRAILAGIGADVAAVLDVESFRDVA